MNDLPIACAPVQYIYIYNIYIYIYSSSHRHPASARPWPSSSPMLGPWTTGTRSCLDWFLAHKSQGLNEPDRIKQICSKRNNWITPQLIQTRHVQWHLRFEADWETRWLGRIQVKKTVVANFHLHTSLVNNHGCWKQPAANLTSCHPSNLCNKNRPLRQWRKSKLLASP